MIQVYIFCTLIKNNKLLIYFYKLYNFQKYSMYLKKLFLLVNKVKEIII